VSKTPVTVSIATLPDRLHLLKQTLASISPQVDHINLYLDGHPEPPIEALVDAIEPVDVRFMRAGRDDRRRGDAGKFFWAGQVEGYHFTCDDDLIYPDDYVERMVATIEKYGRRACVGVLGTIFKGRWSSYYLIPAFDRVGGEKIYRKIGTAWGNPADWWCHSVGTGTLAYHTSTIQLSPDDFKIPNMADVWFALAAHRQRVPCVAIARPENWITIMEPPKGTTIWEQWHEHRDDSVQTEAIKSVAWGEPLSIDADQ
jgi:hypothetical protein